MGASSRRRLLPLAALALAIAGCSATTTHQRATLPAPSASDHGNSEAVRTTFTHCGIERWSIKTGTDPDASLVDTASVTPTTIAALAAIPAPSVLPSDSRIKPVETTVYRVKATLREYKQENDGDYHLVLADGSATMIAEIPAPACVGASSPFAAAIATTRAAFDAKYQPSDVWQQAGISVTVTGVGFFDSLHGQTGVAPNGIELHPVLSVTFGSGS